MKTIYIICVIALLAVVPTARGHLDELLFGLGNTVRGVQQKFGFGLSLGFGHPNNGYNDEYRLQQENEYLRRQYEAMVHRDRRPDTEQIHVHNNNYMVMNPDGKVYGSDPTQQQA
ncbi:hypothetical protein RR46_04096 [Papilio xuthus]|uniref:Cuticular protein n=1 Tax=Papilio xuthus TaxID=66420 RepID=A0A194QJ76_PAPXU|nr:hypothetical protein RR46_04096 [Papilio xuthus]